MVAPFARRRTSQPQSPTPIDWGNPLTAGLVSWMLPSDGTWANTNGVGFNYAAPHGVSRNFVAASSQALTKPVAHGQAVTFFALARRATTGINEALVSTGASTSDRRLLYLTASDDVSMFTGSGASTRFGTWSTLVAANQVRAYAGTDNGSVCTAWADGILRATGASSSFSVAAPTTAAVGGYYNSGALTAGFYMRGDVFVAAIWDRVLSRAEIESLSANPWQLFANNTPIRPLYLPAGGGDVSVELSGVSATGAVGNLGPALSVAVSGVSATGSVGTLTANLSVALTGVAATGAVGDLTASIEGDVTVELTGVSATGQVGSLGPSLSVSVSGNAATGSVGTLGVSISRALSGVSATGAVGTLTAVGGTLQVRTKGLRKTRYVPRRILARRPEFEDITRSVNEEFERLNDALESPFTHQLLEVLHVEPSRKFEGMVALADGSDWDPGTGKGVYVYYDSAWNRLG